MEWARLLYALILDQWYQCKSVVSLVFRVDMRKAAAKWFWLRFGYFQICHHAFCGGGAGSVRGLVSLNSTIWAPPHRGQKLVNASMAAPAGTFGNTTRIRSEGASNNSEKPHFRQG